MKKVLVAVTSLTCLINTLVSQQSYFNVPSSDKTPKGTFFFQEQISVDATELISNSTFDWGITHNWEVGFNISQINFDPKFNLRKSSENSINQSQIYPLVTINSQYFYQLNPKHQLSVAGVWGYSPINQFNFKNQAGYFFINDKYSPWHGLKITLGINTGNSRYSGLGNWMDATSKNISVGYQIGTEINLYKEKLLFIGDHISGRNSMGYSTAGFAYKVPNHWILSFGALIANPNSGNPSGVVMEFTRAIGD